MPFVFSGSLDLGAIDLDALDVDQLFAGDAVDIFSTATLKRCANCGREPDEGVTRCRKCGLVGYCSKECEVAGRENHKPQCELTCSARAAVLTSDSTLRTIYSCHAGFLVPGAPIPDGVPANIRLMHAALVEMTKPSLDGMNDPKVTKKGKVWKKEYEGEATYKPYFEELVENEREWLEFFRHHENSYHCMMTCKVLNTLASVHCKRGANEECGRHLVMYYKIFAIYKDTCSQRGDPEEWCENMEYRIKQTHYYLNTNLKKYEANVSICRHLACHEAKYPAPDNSPHLGFFLARARRAGRSRVTAEEILAVPRDEILSWIVAVAESSRYKQFAEKEEKRTKLLLCEHCGKKESGLKQFKVCPRCMLAPYCSRACQAAAWKGGHKKVCGKSKKK